MDFTILSWKIRENNVKILREEIESYWVDIKIKNHLKRNPYLKMSIQDVKDKIIKDDILASFFIKDPSKQNFTENYIANYLSEIDIIENFENLSSSIKLFVHNGEITNVRFDGLKSVDYTWEYNGLKFYATQKFTKSNGGAQDNQFNDVINFLENCQNNDKDVFFAIVDGSYYTEKKIDILKKYEKNNIIICGFEDVKGILIEKFTR